MIARLTERRFALWMAAIFVVAMALRIAIRLVAGTQGFWIDGYGQYASLAQSICDGDGYAFPGGPPTAFRVPLYSYFVAATTSGTGSPWPLILAQAFLAGLVTWQLIVLRDKDGAIRALRVGCVLGLLLLTRATMLPFALCGLVIAALPHQGPNHPRTRLVPALIAGAAMLAVLSPWLAYSHRVTGAYGLGTEGGASLYAGNHPLTFSVYPVSTIDESRVNVFSSLGAGELAELAKLHSDEVATSRLR